MTATELRRLQSDLDLTNAVLCKSLGVTKQTLCNWKSGRVPIPNPAALALTMLAHYRGDMARWVSGTNN